MLETHSDSFESGRITRVSLTAAPFAEWVKAALAYRAAFDALPTRERREEQDFVLFESEAKGDATSSSSTSAASSSALAADGEDVPEYLAEMSLRQAHQAKHGSSSAEPIAANAVATAAGACAKRSAVDAEGRELAALLARHQAVSAEFQAELDAAAQEQSQADTHAAAACDSTFHGVQDAQSLGTFQAQRLATELAALLDAFQRAQHADLHEQLDALQARDRARCQTERHGLGTASTSLLSAQTAAHAGASDSLVTVDAQSAALSLASTPAEIASSL